MTDSPHPGAPKGNTNALKHGFYARSFRAAEQTGLDEFDPTTLQNEIELMRVFILRTAELGEQAATLAESMTLLNVLSRAAISLGVLIRTQQALTVRKESAELADLSVQLNTASRRASALLKLLPPQPPEPPVEVPPTARRASSIPSPSGRGQGEGSSLPPTPIRGQGEGSSLPPTPIRGQGEGSSPDQRIPEGSSLPPTPTPAPEPIYTLSPENCLPSPQCFTCPDRTLCPDCQVYLRTHTPPLVKIAESSVSTTQAAEIGALPSPLSLFYAIDPQSLNCSELFPPNNFPSQSLNCSELFPPNNSPSQPQETA